MIIQELRNIGGNTLVYSYSDAGMYLERDGVQYMDAYDLPQSNYTYTETDIPLLDEEQRAILSKDM